MPIYAYRCESCGFAQDLLRKISDPPLSVCPECNKDTFRKQVTAAGFQLKGSGWYVTDFRNNGGAPATTGKTGAAATSGGAESASTAGSETSSAATSESSSTASAAPASSSGAASSDGAASSS
ncbi:FmdB family zinc ribbon protein [Pararobbsia silviterrae]|uniref:Zinc ribbon domain-containing protein n=1 Tax=Pararobbsia silviterrae TaxID=1792498 RepID=A0A494Y980_9BURK|nr:FmdB family zinc ribbon protein [Pararobbsia silviterrae]RKP58906.1 zinc ribbon domain-containing protein [Pararobbsia silviterrae]